MINATIGTILMENGETVVNRGMARAIDSFDPLGHGCCSKGERSRRRKTTARINIGLDGITHRGYWQEIRSRRRRSITMRTVTRIRDGIRM